MTKEEAAKRLFGGWYISTSGNLCVDEGERDAFCEAIGVAVNALRTKRVKLGRSRWEGCETCKGGRYRRGEYCPGCGRPLTEEAWMELEGRINSGQD